jgi:hypothetical protein
MTEILDYPGLSVEHIKYMMFHFRENHHIESNAFLRSWYDNGFVVMMDDWENAWIYVGDNPTPFNMWLENAPQEGLTSFSFFEQREVHII